MRTDAYVTNFEEAISKYFKGGDTPSHVKKHLFWDALGKQNSAMGFQKLAVSFEVLIKSFWRVMDMTAWDALSELHIKKLKEGESINSFSNHFMGLLPLNIDLDHRMTVYKYVRRLPAPGLQAILIYNNNKSMDEIMEVCDMVWKVM